MANVFSNFGVDFDNLNLNRLQTGSVNVNYLDNAFVTVNGIVYADFYEVVWDSQWQFLQLNLCRPELNSKPKYRGDLWNCNGVSRIDLEREHLSTVHGAWRTSIFPLLRYGTHR